MAESTNIGRRRAANVDTSSAFYQERRRDIIEAAAHVFQERGFEASTIGLIADRLGSDRATLYYYFSSKQDLFREVVREVATKTIAEAELIAASDESPDRKLGMAINAVLESYSSSYPYMHVFLQESFPAIPSSSDAWDDESRGWSKRYYLAIRQIIQQGLDEGLFHSALPVTVVTMGVLGTVNWAYRWYKPGSRLSAGAIAEGFASMLLNGLMSAPDRKPSAAKRKPR